MHKKIKGKPIRKLKRSRAKTHPSLSFLVSLDIFSIPRLNILKKGICTRKSEIQGNRRSPF